MRSPTFKSLQSIGRRDQLRERIRIILALIAPLVIPLCTVFAADNALTNVEIYRSGSDSGAQITDIDRFVSFNSMACPEVTIDSDNLRPPQAFSCGVAKLVQAKLAQISETYSLRSYLYNNRFECIDNRGRNLECRREFVVITTPGSLFIKPVRELRFKYQITVAIPREDHLNISFSKIKVLFEKHVISIAIE